MVDRVKAEELELIKTRSNFQNALQEFWVEALDRSPGRLYDVTKLVEAFGILKIIL